MKERILKINSLIKRELGKILLREIDFPADSLVTVTRVDTSPNLIQAKVYISTIPDESSQEVIAILKGQIYFIQQKLNNKLNMRPMPRIFFVREDKTVEAGRVEELLEEIKKDEN
jgi:ribosome-binding factor A